MRRIGLGLAVALAAGIGAALSAGSAGAAAPRIGPHVIGTFANAYGEGQGGYVVWSNGRVEAVDAAPYYGSIARPENDVAAFAEDTVSGGYWLVTKSWTVFSLGPTCGSGEVLSHPAHPAGAPILGAINQENASNEGFAVLSASRGAIRSYNYTCNFHF